MNFRLSKPIFIENSRLPVFLSHFSPISIWAISFGFWVWCRGELSDKTKQHETIHFHQQLEMLFVGQWILYIVFYLIGLIKYRNGEKAYRANPFEKEAYDNESNQFYLITRKRWCWSQYKIWEILRDLAILRLSKVL